MEDRRNGPINITGEQTRARQAPPKKAREVGGARGLSRVQSLKPVMHARAVQPRRRNPFSSCTFRAPQNFCLTSPKRQVQGRPSWLLLPGIRPSALPWRGGWGGIERQCNSPHATFRDRLCWRGSNGDLLTCLWVGRPHSDLRAAAPSKQTAEQTAAKREKATHCCWGKKSKKPKPSQCQATLNNRGVAIAIASAAAAAGFLSPPWSYHSAGVRVRLGSRRAAY